MTTASLRHRPIFSSPMRRATSDRYSSRGIARKRSAPSHAAPGAHSTAAKFHSSSRWASCARPRLRRAAGEFERALEHEDASHRDAESAADRRAARIAHLEGMSKAGVEQFRKAAQQAGRHDRGMVGRAPALRQHEIDVAIERHRPAGFGALESGDQISARRRPATRQSGARANARRWGRDRRSAKGLCHKPRSSPPAQDRRRGPPGRRPTTRRSAGRGGAPA